MANDGIGARVLRKEDKRFITGKGRYTDDIAMTGMTHAVFVRSPHAHATIKSIDVSRGEGGARRRRRADRRRSRRRQDRRPDLRLDDPFQGRLADEGRRPSGDRQGRRPLCRRHRRRGHRRDPQPGPRRRRAGHGRLRGAAGRHRSGQGAGRRPRRRSIPRRRGNLIFQLVDRRRGGDQGGARQGRSTSSSSTSSTTGSSPTPSSRARRSAPTIPPRSHFTLYNTTQNPHVAPAGALGLRRHRAGEQAPRDRARRRRRLRLEDLHLPRGDDLPAGRRSGSAAARSSGPRTAANRSSPTPTAATTSPMPRWPSMPTTDHRPEGRTPSPISAPTCRPSRRRSRPISTRTLLSGQYDIPAIYAEVDAVYTNTTPVDAVRGAGRPEAAFVVERLMETAARELGVDPAELRRKNFIRTLPAPDAGDHELRRRRLRSLARRGAEGGRLRRLQGSARRRRRSAASSAASASRAGSRPAASRRRRRSARSAPASASGNWPKCGSIRSARSRS